MLAHFHYAFFFSVVFFSQTSLAHNLNMSAPYIDKKYSTLLAAKAGELLPEQLILSYFNDDNTIKSSQFVSKEFAKSIGMGAQLSEADEGFYNIGLGMAAGYYSIKLLKKIDRSTTSLTAPFVLASATSFASSYLQSDNLFPVVNETDQFRQNYKTVEDWILNPWFFKSLSVGSKLALEARVSQYLFSDSFKDCMKKLVEPISLLSGRQKEALSGVIPSGTSKVVSVASLVISTATLELLTNNILAYQETEIFSFEKIKQKLQENVKVAFIQGYIIPIITIVLSPLFVISLLCFHRYQA